MNGECTDIAFIVPMTWIKQTNHTTDCSFWFTKSFFVKKKNNLVFCYSFICSFRSFPGTIRRNRFAEQIYTKRKKATVEGIICWIIQLKLNGLRFEVFKSSNGDTRIKIIKIGIFGFRYPYFPSSSKTIFVLIEY